MGLFQDLQNVNPFDETFKKAVESSKCGTLHVPERTNDDTLHTPHILPHVQENVEKYISSRIDSENQTQSGDFCISTVATIDGNFQKTSETCSLSIVADKNVAGERTDIQKAEDKLINLKSKLKESIIKSKDKKTPPSPVLLKCQKENKSRKLKETIVINNKKQTCDEGSSNKEKMREMNRAAQLRCRKRKQIQWRQMEEELKTLKVENVRLHNENQNFKQKLYSLKELIIMQKKKGDKNPLGTFYFVFLHG